MDSSQSAVTAGTGGGGNGMMISQTNDTAATPAVDDPKQSLNHVINSIQKTLGLLHQLYLTVSSLNAASQLPLLHRLYVSYVLSIAISSLYFLLPFLRHKPLWVWFCSNSLVMELDNMVKLAEKCNVQIPMEVLK